VIGVFIAFTMSQIRMVKHWQTELRGELDHGRRRRMRRSQLINALGAAATGIVFVIVLVTKFLDGAYLIVIAIPVLFLLMRAVNRHYATVADEIAVGDVRPVGPTRIHVLVLVSTVSGPSLRALAYASPYREITRPVLIYVRDYPRIGPRDIVTVINPEYVVGHWWEQLLHNQSALRLKGRLLFQPGVMVTSVPWQLDSSADLAKKPIRPDGPKVPPVAPLPGG
jgi:hypothetical protein